MLCKYFQPDIHRFYRFNFVTISDQVRNQDSMQLRPGVEAESNRISCVA